MAEPRKSGGSSAASRGRAAAAEPITPPNFRTLVPKDLNVDFVGKRRFFLILSTVLNLLAVVLFFTRGINFGIDFKGGTDIRLRFAEPTTATALRDELSGLNLRDLTVQDFGVQGKEFLLRFEIDEGEIATFAAAPRMIAVAPKIWNLVGIGISSRMMIEAPEGLVIFDTGDDLEDGEKALVEFRKVSDKPIKAIIA